MEVVRHLGERVAVSAIAANSNIDLLEQQAREFSPEIIGVFDLDKASELRKRLPGFNVLGGMDALKAVATCSSADMVISAIVGTAGLIPTMAAIEAGKHIGLANKEVLVSAGALITGLAREKGVDLVPIDSEHNAIFQCLQGENKATVRRIILTASGGPFRDFSYEQLQSISVEDALNHPTWKMGPKVTVDSSTLMNKGLEMIEAHWLFNVSPDQIEVVVHRQSIIHSMVEFQDGSIIAQMNEPDMINPIQHAITFPERMQGMFKPFDFSRHTTLNFEVPDTKKFSCLELAYQAIREGKSMPCFMNAANETLVNRFLNREFAWRELAGKLESLMLRHQSQDLQSLDSVLEIDKLARMEAKTA
ncbi:MAG: 1-deoxy-D-xylulose-5-phosphate reductoisomerase [Chlamydiales bacterium]|jgi:1-deoxy-D-xylulose-5-phosphate reductoisomerase